MLITINLSRKSLSMPSRLSSILMSSVKMNPFKMSPDISYFSVREFGVRTIIHYHRQEQRISRITEQIATKIWENGGARVALLAAARCIFTWQRDFHAVHILVLIYGYVFCCEYSWDQEYLILVWFEEQILIFADAYFFFPTPLFHKIVKKKKGRRKKLRSEC